MTNSEYNIVLSYCKFHLHLKFSVINCDVVPESDSGTWHIIYKDVCSSPSHEMIY
jgi:hypothetical protein